MEIIDFVALLTGSANLYWFLAMDKVSPRMSMKNIIFTNIVQQANV
jgi:hypothetical protein